MADWHPIVLNMGSDKKCEVCGKLIKPPEKNPNQAAAMEADGITLSSHPPISFHANCLREVLLLVCKIKPIARVEDPEQQSKGSEHAELAGKKTEAPAKSG